MYREKWIKILVSKLLGMRNQMLKIKNLTGFLVVNFLGSETFFRQNFEKV